MARALGIDLGTRQAKAVLVEKTARGLSVLGFARVAVPAEPQVSYIRELLSQVGWKGEPVAAAVRARETTLRELTLPFTDPEQLSQVVRFEAENYLPFPLEEAALDFIPLGGRGAEEDARRPALGSAEQGPGPGEPGPAKGRPPGRRGQRLLVFAVRRATLSALLDGLEAAGADPYLVSAEPTALLEALRSTGSLPRRPTILLDLGAASTTVIYLSGGSEETPAQPAYLRVLRVAGADLEAPGDVSRYVDKVARELGRLLAALPEAARFAPVLLTGGNATEQVIEALAGSLAVEVGRLRLEPSGPGQEGAPSREFATAEVERYGLVALGLALSLLGPPAYPVNFRAGEFRYRPRLEKWRRPLSFVLAGWTALAVVFGAGLEVRLRDLSRMERRLEEREQAIWEAVSPGGPRPPDVLAWTHGQLLRLEGLASSGTRGGRVSALETLRSILAAIPPEVKVTLRSANITPERARIDLAVSSHTAAARIVAAVNEKTDFVASPKNLRYERGSSRFELEAVPREEGSGGQ